MFSILDRYIGRTILGTISITLFLLVSLSTILRFIDQLRRVNATYDALSAALYSILMTPKDLEVFFPISALLGALIGLGMLASRSELVVMETAGFSRLCITQSVMKTTIPMVLLIMIISEWVAPVSEQLARNMRSQKIYGNTLIATQSSIWAKDGNNYVYIGKVDNEQSISNINIYITAENQLTTIIHADYATFDDGVWQLVQVEKNDLTNPDQIVGANILSMTWQTNITPEQLNIVAQEPSSLSATGLHYYINYLNDSGQDSSYYRLLFWQKLFKPISVAIMMLLALSFIFGPLRSVAMGIRVLTGIIFGFLFYFSDTLFSKFTVVVGLPPIIGALLASCLFFIISLYVLRHKR